MSFSKTAIIAALIAVTQMNLVNTDKFVHVECSNIPQTCQQHQHDVMMKCVDYAYSRDKVIGEQRSLDLFAKLFLPSRKAYAYFVHEFTQSVECDPDSLTKGTLQTPKRRRLYRRLHRSMLSLMRSYFDAYFTIKTQLEAARDQYLLDAPEYNSSRMEYIDALQTHCNAKAYVRSRVRSEADLEYVNRLVDETTLKDGTDFTTFLRDDIAAAYETNKQYFVKQWDLCQVDQEAGLPVSDECTQNAKDKARENYRTSCKGFVAHLKQQLLPIWSEFSEYQTKQTRETTKAVTSTTSNNDGRGNSKKRERMPVIPTTRSNNGGRRNSKKPERMKRWLQRF